MLTENQLINKNQRFDVYAADDELRANALNLAVCGITTFQQFNSIYSDLKLDNQRLFKCLQFWEQFDIIFYL